MLAKDFYKNARAYDIAFSDRDFEYETKFLKWCLKNHAKVDNKKSSKKSFLEMACGPAQHARLFAKGGWRSIALDLSPEMIEYAKSKGVTRMAKRFET